MPHTVTLDHFATGEGRTIGILYTMDPDPKKHAAHVFGAYFASGVEVRDGLHFDGEIAEALVPARVRNRLEAGGGYMTFHATLYVNYS